MSQEKTTYASVLRACSMLEVLAGEIPDGLSNKDLCAALGCSAPDVTRMAAVLVEKGWVTRMDNGRFRITARFGQLITRVLAGFEHSETRLSDMKRSYTL